MGARCAFQSRGEKDTFVERWTFEFERNRERVYLVKDLWERDLVKAGTFKLPRGLFDGHPSVNMMTLLISIIFTQYMRIQIVIFPTYDTDSSTPSCASLTIFSPLFPDFLKTQIWFWMKAWKPFRHEWEEFKIFKVC